MAASLSVPASISPPLICTQGLRSIHDKRCANFVAGHAGELEVLELVDVAAGAVAYPDNRGREVDRRDGAPGGLAGFRPCKTAGRVELNKCLLTYRIVSMPIMESLHRPPRFGACRFG